MPKKEKGTDSHWVLYTFDEQVFYLTDNEHGFIQRCMSTPDIKFASFNNMDINLANIKQIDPCNPLPPALPKPQEQVQAEKEQETFSGQLKIVERWETLLKRSRENKEWPTWVRERMVKMCQRRIDDAMKEAERLEASGQ